MHAVLLVLASTAVGVDWGYRPLSTGGIEYIVQIEPQAFEELARGGPEIIHTASPDLRDIRKYRLTVGTQKLPRGGRAAAATEQVAAAGVQVTPARFEADGREHIVELDSAAIEKMRRDMDLVYELQDIRRFRIRLKSPPASSPLTATSGNRDKVIEPVEVASPPSNTRPPEATTPPIATTPAKEADASRVVTPLPMPALREPPPHETPSEPKVDLTPAAEPTKPQLPFRAAAQDTDHSAPGKERLENPQPQLRAIEPFPGKNPVAFPTESEAESPPVRERTSDLPSFSKQVTAPQQATSGQPLPLNLPPLELPAFNQPPEPASKSQPDAKSPDMKLPDVGVPQDDAVGRDPFSIPAENQAEALPDLKNSDDLAPPKRTNSVAKEAAPPDNRDPFATPKDAGRVPPDFQTQPSTLTPSGSVPPNPFPAGDSTPALPAESSVPVENSVPPLNGLPPLNLSPESSSKSRSQPPGNSLPPTADDPTLGNQLTSFSTPAGRSNPGLSNSADRPPFGMQGNASALPPGSPTTPTQDAEPTAASLQSPDSAGDNKQWWGVTGALLALFASLGGNAYLGWMNFDLRRQYAALLDMLKQQRTVKNRAS